MATIAFALAGQAIGGSLAAGTFLGVAGQATVLGFTGASIGGAIGSIAGSVIDAALAPTQHSEGQRLDVLTVTSATEGGVVPRVFGRMRVGGNLIWATDFTETVSTTGGGKGGGSKISVTTYSYSANFAVAICEGPIIGIGRIWADGDLLDTSTLTMRIYNGDETQVADPFIATTMAADGAPAYRGTAYVMFEDMMLNGFGNRIPQLSFEVFAPLADADTAEGTVRAVNLIPGAGEFVYATDPVTATSGPTTTAENIHAEDGRADLMASLDRLEALAPNVESVSLVAAWLGNDLRAGNCQIEPGVEVAAKTTTPQTWVVDGVARSAAHLISTDTGGAPLFGGTPNDASIVQAIQKIKTRGLRVTFNPFLLMDVPAGNTLPNPYSDNAASNGQEALPWRGRITVSPAAGYAGSVDKTASATAQVTAFFGAAAASDFSVSGEAVSWIGGADWGYRRMILHYAHLCAAAGGVDTFLIGSELVGMTTVRDSATNYPTVAALQTLAADVSAILGGATQVGYAADWTEYFGHQPSDGTGDVFFHLDPLWSDANIDFVGIDNYLPISDWRDGFDHLDALAGYPSIYDQTYLQAGIEGGERFDWYYASDADRDAQTRTTITDGAYSKPWVFRPKDIRSWWLNAHYDRPGGVENGTPTGWVPQSKPVRFTEFGCPAIDRGTNQPNAFYDPKSSASATPHYSRGWRDDAIQRAYLEATTLYWAANNLTSTVYAGDMIDLANASVWAWDARPYPWFPGLTDVWSDFANWEFGHWLNGRLGSIALAALVRKLCVDSGLLTAQIDVSELRGSADGLVITSIESPIATINMLAAHFGFDSVESEGIIKFTMRGGASALTLTSTDLVAGDAEDIERVRAQETELPQVLRWTVQRSDQDYNNALVEARRITSGSVRVAAQSFPVAVPPEEAERRARRALIEAWVGRETASFALPPSRLALDPGDVVTLDGGDLRITRLVDSDKRGVESAQSDREVYDLPPGPSRGVKIAVPASFGQASVTVLDVPLINGDHTAPRPLIAVDADPWPGTDIVLRSPELSNWASFASITARASVGTLSADLPAGPVGRWDNANTLDITLDSGTLASVTDLALFAGGNAFAIETTSQLPIGAPEGIRLARKWEIVQGRDATLVSAGHYQITGLLRGQRGTEWAMNTLTQTGAKVVVLNASVFELPFSVSELGVPWNITMGPASKPVGDGSWVTVSVTPSGASLKPFAPVQMAGVVESSGDVTLSWVRRSRDPAADAWEPVDVPLLDTPEAYEIDIMSGATIKRTLVASTTTATYAVADQIADFGSALAVGGALNTIAYQISPTLGRGFSGTETIVLT